ncbi:MAG: hypothetical protein KDE27_01190 [Planctomycetes bacterium]|nr:hypothetical protein [Planctomycetota bacterium]
MRPRDFFHRVSYLQYPVMIAAVAAALRPVLADTTDVVADLNTTLMLMGIGVAFSTLQDTTKVQNEISRRVWSHPRRARFALIAIAGLVVFFLGSGTLLWFFGGERRIAGVAVGLVVFGIGVLGLLKAAIEMAEYQAVAGPDDQRTTVRPPPR